MLRFMLQLWPLSCLLIASLGEGLHDISLFVVLERDDEDEETTAEQFLLPCDRAVTAEREENGVILMAQATNDTLCALVEYARLCTTVALRAIPTTVSDHLRETSSADIPDFFHPGGTFTSAPSPESGTGTS
jgi:hypothetical protein